MGEGCPCRWEQVPQRGGSASRWGSSQCCARSAFADCILVLFAELKEAMTESHLLRAWVGGADEKSVVTCVVIGTESVSFRMSSAKLQAESFLPTTGVRGLSCRQCARRLGGRCRVSYAGSCHVPEPGLCPLRRPPLVSIVSAAQAFLDGDRKPPGTCPGWSW